MTVTEQHVRRILATLNPPTAPRRACVVCGQPDGVLVDCGHGWVHVNPDRCTP